MFVQVLRVLPATLGLMLVAGTAGPSLAQIPEAARATFTVSGFVKDGESGETLPNAHVYEAERRIGTVTNTYGFFSLTLPGDSVNLVISYLGFEPGTYAFALTRDTQLDVDLTPVRLVADSVTVIGERVEPIEESVRMSTIRVPVAQVRSLPSILGEVDLLRSLQLLPGVQSGSEAASGIFVRGGSGDQTLLLLDGARVYNAFHLFGFFSVFNADALKHVELTKGGFPARYGGTLASVVEVGMKEGNAKRHSGQVAIGAVATRVIVEGPIAKDKASFIVSGRRTYLDLLARPFMQDEVVGFNFYDLNAKINSQVTPKDRLYLSVYHGRDGFSFRDKPDWEMRAFLRWGNVTSTARWNRLLSDKLFSNVTATFSDYAFRVGTDSRDDSESFSQRYYSGIREASLKADLEYVPAPSHYVRFGASGSLQRFSPGAISANIKGDEQASYETPRSELTGAQYAVYAEDDITLGPRLKLNAGLRLAAFSITRRFFTSLEPRLSARYLLPVGWAVKGSYARMRQFVFLLHNSGLSLPTDLWLPATAKVPPQGGHIVAVGAARSLTGRRLELSAEGYYRTMSGQVEYKNAARYLSPGEDWQDKVELGQGRSYGGELLVRKSVGRTTGWVGYTLSWTRRQFDNLNGGASFPYRYDRRHDISIVATHRLGSSIELSGLWTFASGSAVTLPTRVYRGWPLSIYPCTGCVIESYDKRNDYRMRNYHRLDLGVNFIKYRGRNERTISVGAYNVYSRRNPFFLYLDQVGGREVLKQVSLLPVIPYVTYRRTF